MPFKKGYPSWNKGKKMPWLSERNRINNPQEKGELSSTWKGGRDIYLKRQSLIRDNYECQICETHQDELDISLHVHHIDYDKDNLNPDNLISLCPNCHSKTNHNRDKWLEYFNKQSTVA